MDALGDPVRRRIVELLARGERAAGELGEVVEREFRIKQPTVSAHLKILRDAGVTTVRVDGTRRMYATNPRALDDVTQWVAKCRRFWEHKLDALETELHRGRRAQRQRARTRTSPKKRRTR